MAERIDAEGAQVLGVYEEDFYAGEPAVTVNQYGRGKAYFIAARTGQDFLDDFYQDLAEALAISPERRGSCRWDAKPRQGRPKDRPTGST